MPVMGLKTVISEEKLSVMMEVRVQDTPRLGVFIFKPGQNQITILLKTYTLLLLLKISAQIVLPNKDI